MKYLLDTNILTAFFRNERNVINEFSQRQDAIFFISSISIAEFYYGYYKNTSKKAIAYKKVLQEVIRSKLLLVSNLGKVEAEMFGNIKAKLEKKGKRLDDLDLQIASIAITNKMILVTNDKHFSRIENLKVENWMN